jgi:hypothetical protein
MKLTDKQKEILQALLDGKDIEHYDESDGVWESVNTISVLTYFGEKYLRIKPEVPEDIIVTEFKKYLPKLEDAYDAHNVEYTYDGVTHELKSVRLIDAKVNKDVSVLGEKANTDIKPQPDSVVWFSNIGNDTERWPEGCGVNRNTKIEIKRRNGTTEIDYAHKWTVSWTETDKDEYDIVRFRILKDQNE